MGDRPQRGLAANQKTATAFGKIGYTIRMEKLLPILTLTVMLAVAGCGFTPVHSTAAHHAMQVDLAAVQVDVDDTRQGQLLKAEIQDQVNPDTQRTPKKYTLKITYKESEVPVFINPDGTSGRGDLLFQSAYSITRLSDGVVVARGNLQRTSSYNTSLNADYSSFVSEEDARNRGILELAQDYKLRLTNLLPTLNDPHAGEVKAPEPEKPSLVPSVTDIYENRRQGF